MKRFVSKSVGFVIGLMLLATKAHAVLVCPSANQPAGTAWCDADASRFLSDVLCVVEPVDGPPSSSIDAEVVGGGACVLGKFKTPAAVHKVVDFVASYDFPGDPLLGPTGVLVPELASVASAGEFLMNVPLDQAGLYSVGIQGRVVNDDGSFQDISVVRSVLRVSQPHLTVTKARVGGATVDCSAADPSCFGVNDIEGDSDGDGICDGPMPIPGVCGPGPDPSNDASHAVELDVPEVAARSVELCIAPHGTEPSAGNSVVVRATNTVTDTGVTPAKEIVVEANCLAPGETYCQIATDSFCSGGFKITVPLGHGRNDIELFVNNLATGYDEGAGEHIQVKALDVDLQGPTLCVNYLNESGHKIDDTDGKSILSSEASAVTVDVTLGACGSPAETVGESPADCDADSPPACADAAVCLQSNGEKDGENSKFTAMCPVEIAGTVHYRAAFPDLRFPLNTAVIRALDGLGNQTVETHAFGYGNVRPLFNNEGNFVVKEAVIPNGVGGFISEAYVKNEILPVVLKAVNSDTFKNDFIPGVLDPRQPNDGEIACLKSIEDEVNSTFDHLANREKVVAIKLFCDGPCADNVGAIEVPSLFFLNQNRLRVQLKIKGLHGRGEMYTIRFTDSDDDSIVDVEDDDADNDGVCDKFIPSIEDCEDENNDEVCDKEIGLTGSQGDGLNPSAKCTLDKSIPKDECPDADTDDGTYFGCSDLDDDGDGVPDVRDLPGRIVPDPDFGTMVMPLLFQVKELALNLDVTFVKDGAGRLRLQMNAAAGRPLVEAIADGDYPGNLIEFDCDKDVSEIYQGGQAGEEGNGQNLGVDSEACRAFKSLSNALNGNGNLGQDVVIGISEHVLPTPWADPHLIDRHRRQNQGTNDQLIHTLEATAKCSIPKRLEATLDSFEDDKVAAISTEVLDNRFHLDFFAPLGTADVNIDPRGLGFSGGGLLVPAGVSDPNDTTERNAMDFLAALPEEFKHAKFGPLSPAFDDEPVDPIEAAFQMGKEIDLAIAEETINSVLHSMGLLLWDLANHEGDVHQTLDMTATKLREDFGMGIPDIGSSDCKDKNRDPVSGDSYTCFPFSLNIENVIGPTALNYVDFDGDGMIGAPGDAKAPVLIRTAIDPQSPPTVRLVSATPIGSWDGSSSPTNPAALVLEAEIGLNNVAMSLFEEKVADWSADIIAGTGDIKDWCDADRQPGANRAQCDGEHKLPMITFKASGRIFVTALISVKDEGILRLEAGLSSVERAVEPPAVVTPGDEMDLDRTKTYLEFTVSENHTIIPDNELTAAFRRQIELMLPKYVFGNVRDIRGNIPVQLPLEAYCAVYEEASPELCACVKDPDKPDCELAHSLQRVWNRLDLDEFGVAGFRLDRTMMGVTADDLGPRYLTIGVDSTIELIELTE